MVGFFYIRFRILNGIFNAYSIHHPNPMSRFFTFILISTLLFSCSREHTKDKVLFVTTNIDVMNGEPNGTYLIELAVPFGVFLKNGYDIDIVSPKGGLIPIYHVGDTTDLVKHTLVSQLYQEKTKNSQKPENVDSKEYKAVIIPGGYGQFWDTHKNDEILKIISEIHESGGVIGSIGHGTATLINVTSKSGEYLVKDKTMTCFPTWNEKNIMKQSNYGQLLPYDMEEELKKRGANLKIYDHQKKINYEIVDPHNRLVTAAFANSGEFVAKEVLKILNVNK